MSEVQKLHEWALQCVKQFQKAEAALLDILQKIDDKKVFLALGYPSLFRYAVDALQLSEGMAFNFINVARKALEVPELKLAVSRGELSVSKARKIVPVINKQNSQEWIQKAIELSQLEVEREVAMLNPDFKIRETLKPTSATRTEMRCGLSHELEKKLRRAQDLVSQQKQKNCALEETLEVLLDEYLNHRDPLIRAERINKKNPTNPTASSQPVVRQVNFYPPKSPPALSSRQAIPAPIEREVILRDGNACAFVTLLGKKCGSQRWLQIHHIKPVARGGTNSVDNLIILCAAHHRLIYKQRMHSNRKLNLVPS